MKQLSYPAKHLLQEIVNSTNPTEYLSDRFSMSSTSQRDELRVLLKELKEGGYVNVMWADNIPWHIAVTSFPSDKQGENNDEVSNTISIGNNNRIKDSVVGNHTTIIHNQKKQKGFYERHQILVNFLISLAVGLLLMFSFAKELVSFVENLF